jgi:hypothetical protein
MSRKKRQQDAELPPRLRVEKKPMSKEEFLEWAFGRLTEKLSSAARQNLQANYELQYDYPDEWVVFLDDWAGEGRKRRLVRRLLAHGPPEDTKRLSDVVAALPLEDQMRIQFIYIRDPFLNEVWI